MPKDNIWAKRRAWVAETQKKHATQPQPKKDKGNSQEQK